MPEPTPSAPPDLRPRVLPLLCADLPGTGGLIREEPEDFVVEEIPAYLPSGQGDHLYLQVEKRNASTQEAAAALAWHFAVAAREVGYAGQKDRRAVTRQQMSVHLPGGAKRHPELLTKLPELADERVKVLEAGWHGNKLRLGHLRQNRFILTLRELSVEPELALSRAEAILERLSAEGLPNFYGEQRFGRDQDNAQLGAALLGVGEHPQKSRALRDRHLKRLALSALQSEIFNRCLSFRLTQNSWCRASVGDVLRRRDSGGLFTCEDSAQEQTRIDAGELDITGPMPGPKERPQAQGQAREWEDAVLAELGLSREIFAKAGSLAEGARRPYRVWLEETGAQLLEDGALQVRFTLPPGSYATQVLAEVMKG